MGSIEDEADLAAATSMVESKPLANADHVNPDLAPTTPAQRTWGVKDIAALWISMSAGGS